MPISSQEIGQRVLELRLDRRLTQEGLAFDAEISVPHVSCIENGARKASLGVLVKIANALCVDVTTLLLRDHC
ncbi:MAG: helix-turn-helix domain-containing protein [Clostridiales bacterium]|jgi:transcriptional regulator with XRE-family HTH domain|nr:helix-turn-helix domain-containing protein [Clostridiales bacterium]